MSLQLWFPLMTYLATPARDVSTRLSTRNAPISNAVYSIYTLGDILTIRDPNFQTVQAVDPMPYMISRVYSVAKIPPYRYEKEVLALL